MYDNQNIVDIFNNTINIKNNSSNNLNETNFKLERKSKLIVLVSITDLKVEHKNIIIYRQEIMKDLYCASIIGRVLNDKIVVC